MKNSAKYVVTTHWGTFSLDEGSYRDYLEGKLWISWGRGKTEQQNTQSTCAPANITERAIALRDQAEKTGVLATLRAMGISKAALPYSERLAHISVMEMNLTVRSCNGLRRAGIDTFGELKDLLADETALLNIRNIGQKSFKEIRHIFFTECYSRLHLFEKSQYWQEILDKLD